MWSLDLRVLRAQAYHTVSPPALLALALLYFLLLNAQLWNWFDGFSGVDENFVALTRPPQRFALSFDDPGEFLSLNCIVATTAAYAALHIFAVSGLAWTLYATLLLSGVRFSESFLKRWRARSSSSRAAVSTSTSAVVEHDHDLSEHFYEVSSQRHRAIANTAELLLHRANGQVLSLFFLPLFVCLALAAICTSMRSSWYLWTWFAATVEDVAALQNTRSWPELEGALVSYEAVETAYGGVAEMPSSLFFPFSILMGERSTSDYRQTTTTAEQGGEGNSVAEAYATARSTSFLTQKVPEWLFSAAFHFLYPVFIFVVARRQWIALRGLVPQGPSASRPEAAAVGTADAGLPQDPLAMEQLPRDDSPQRLQLEPAAASSSPSSRLSLPATSPSARTSPSRRRSQEWQYGRGGPVFTTADQIHLHFVHKCLLRGTAVLNDIDAVRCAALRLREQDAAEQGDHDRPTVAIEMDTDFGRRGGINHGMEGASPSSRRGRASIDSASPASALRGGGQEKGMTNRSRSGGRPPSLEQPKGAASPGRPAAKHLQDIDLGHDRTAPNSPSPDDPHDGAAEVLVRPSARDGRESPGPRGGQSDDDEETARGASPLAGSSYQLQHHINLPVDSSPLKLVKALLHWVILYPRAVRFCAITYVMVGLTLFVVGRVALYPLAFDRLHFVPMHIALLLLDMGPTGPRQTQTGRESVLAKAWNEVARKYLNVAVPDNASLKYRCERLTDHAGLYLDDDLRRRQSVAAADALSPGASLACQFEPASTLGGKSVAQVARRGAPGMITSGSPPDVEIPGEGVLAGTGTQPRSVAAFPQRHQLLQQSRRLLDYKAPERGVGYFLFHGNGANVGTAFGNSRMVFRKVFPDTPLTSYLHTYPGYRNNIRDTEHVASAYHVQRRAALLLEAGITKLLSLQTPGPAPAKIVVHGVSLGNCVLAGALSILKDRAPLLLERITHVVVEAPFDSALHIFWRYTHYATLPFTPFLPGKEESTVDNLADVVASTNFLARVAVVKKEFDGVVYPDMSDAIAERVDAILNRRLNGAGGTGENADADRRLREAYGCPGGSGSEAEGLEPCYPVPSLLLQHGGSHNTLIAGLSQTNADFMLFKEFLKK